MAATAAILSPVLGFPGSAFRPDSVVFGTLQAAPVCPIDVPVTCSNSTPVENTCCFESPGGILLQTQFWDYYPPIGPNDTFTLHGLWPDNCDGSYEQFCDSSLNIRDVEHIIKDEFLDAELSNKMNRLWKNFNGNDELLWVHEFNKHATCIKTMRPTCYNPAAYRKNQNVHDFFSISMRLYELVPTFDFLLKAGIVPDNEKTYTKDQIADALSAGFHGNDVFFKCNKYGALQEVWYYHHLRGSILDEEFVPILSLSRLNCPATGIKFLPKTGWKPPPSKGPKPPTGGDRGYLKLSDHSGCLISNGQWYNYGTCASFRLTKLQFGGYNLQSLKGICGVDANGELNCNRKNSASESQFQFDKETKELSYGGKSSWCYNEAGKHGNGKFVQIPVQVAKNGCDSFKLRYG